MPLRASEVRSVTWHQGQSADARYQLRANSCWMDVAEKKKFQIFSANKTQRLKLEDPAVIWYCVLKGNFKDGPPCWQ